MNNFKAPFRVSPLRVGTTIAQGMYFEVADSVGTAVCKVPVGKKITKESDQEHEDRINSHCHEIVELLNGGSQWPAEKPVAVRPTNSLTDGAAEIAPATPKSVLPAAKPAMKSK